MAPAVRLAVVILNSTSWPPETINVFVPARSIASIVVVGVASCQISFRISAVAVAWAIRLLALAALVAFVTWLLLFSGVLLLVAIAFAVAAYLLLRAEVAANPVYLLPPAAGPEEDAEIIEDIVPTGTAVGIPLGFTRRAVRVRREDGERPRP